MPQLAHLSVAQQQFAVRRAAVQDVTAIVALLADDDIGAARETARDTGPAGLAPYLAAFAAIDADPAQLLVVTTDADGAVAGTLLPL